jgi:hypothetical protein
MLQERSVAVDHTSISGRSSRVRLQPQSNPPQDDGNQGNGRGKIVSRLVIADGGASEIFATEHALNETAPLVRFAVNEPGVLAGRVGRSNRGGSRYARPTVGLVYRIPYHRSGIVLPPRGRPIVCVSFSVRRRAGAWVRQSG